MSDRGHAGYRMALRTAGSLLGLVLALGASPAMLAAAASRTVTIQSFAFTPLTITAAESDRQRESGARGHRQDHCDADESGGGEPRRRRDARHRAGAADRRGRRDPRAVHRRIRRRALPP